MDLSTQFCGIINELLRKKIDSKRKDVEAIRLEKKLANIEKQKNGGRGPKIVPGTEGVKGTEIIKKEKLANRFQKNKDKKNEKKIEKKSDVKNDKKEGKNGKKGKKGKEGKEENEGVAVPAWGGFKRIRAGKKGK